MTADEFRSSLQQSRARLFTAIGALSEEQFRASAGDTSWNIATHLAHLLRCERMWAARAAAALREDGVTVASTGITNDDDPGLAQRLAVPQIIHGMQASRRDLEASLSEGDATLSRSITHQTRGRMTIEDIVKKMFEHEFEHCHAVEALARQATASRRVTIPIAPRS